MPFQMKVKPVDARAAARGEATKPAAMSRLKRLFERQFQSVLRISTVVEKPPGIVDDHKEKDEALDGFGVGVGDIEPSSVCLDNLVINFIEDGNHAEKPPRGRCNCFNGNNNEDSSDDEFADAPPLSAPSGDSVDTIKGLVVCSSVVERNLLADAAKLVDKAKASKDKDDRLKVIEDGLRGLGYDSSVCKSKWEVTPSIPSGEHNYIDVIVENCRLILDVDFRSEFEIARSTKTYRAVLQQLPAVFVGRAERLQQIIAVVSDAARQSLKKKGLHVPPWRKCEYMKAKWLSSYQRTTAMAAPAALEESGSGGGDASSGTNDEDVLSLAVSTAILSGEVEKIEGSCHECVNLVCSEDDKLGKDTVGLATPLPWTPPPARPKSGVKIVTGLASVL